MLENNNQPKRFGQFFYLCLVGMILLGAIVITAILRDRIVNPPQFQVSATGQGKIEYQPDIANVVLGVQINKAEQADAALSQMNEKIDKIIGAVKKAGILSQDISTQNYSISPQYDYVENVSKVAGYNGNQQLIIKVKNIKDNNSLLNNVIAEAMKAGANQVSSITFDVSNLNDLKQQARLKAIVDAKIKAVSMSRMAGVRLGKAVGWWENIIEVPGINNSPDYYGGKGGIGASDSVISPNVPTGTHEIIIEISLNYQVKI